MRPISAGLAAALALLAAACGGSGGGKPAVGLAFVVQPAAATAGAPLSPAVRVELRDAEGQVAAGAAPVTLALQGGGGATLAGTATRAAAAGVATFADLSVARAGSGYRLVATAPGLPAATSDAFDVAAGPAAHLTITAQPAAGRTSTPLSPALAVRVTDALDNALDGAEVTVRISTGPAGGALAGGATATTSGGVVEFPDLAGRVAGAYTLEVRVGGLTAATAAFELTDAWTAMGPDGGPVSVAADPEHPATALAGGPAHVGLWRTADGGASWAAVPALHDRTVTPVYQAPGIAWAVGDSVWRSGDGGLTWVESPGLVRSGDGKAVGPAFDPAGGAIYLGVNDWEQRILVSTDAGATWSALTPGPAAGATIVSLATGAGGLAVLTTSGFQRLAPGAGAWSAPVAVDYFPLRVLLHPTDPGVALVAGYAGVHRSTDGGATWSPTLATLTRDLWRDPADPGALLALGSGGSVERSDDGGATFASLSGAPSGGALSLSGTAGQLWLGAATGPFVSTDGGATWAKAAGGLLAARVTAVAVSPADPALLLLGTDAGELWRSADRGASWALVHHGYQVTAILFDPATPERAYAVDGSYLARSTDGGLTWSSLASGPPGVAGVAMCRGLPANLWAYDQNGSGVWRSTDGGDGWTKVYDGIVGTLIVGAVAADAADPLRAWLKVIDFAPGAARTGLYGTVDGGATWTKLASTYGGRLAAGPAGVLWSTSGYSVERSADGGASFTGVTPPLSVYPNATVADPQDGGRALVGGNPSWDSAPGDGIWITEDGGATWFHAMSGHDRFATGAIAVDPSNPDVLYAGTLGGGLLVTTTGGR